MARLFDEVQYYGLPPTLDGFKQFLAGATASFSDLNETVEVMAVYLDEVKARFEQLHLVRNEKIIPCTEDEVWMLEQQIGLPLPGAYMEPLAFIKAHPNLADFLNYHIEVYIDYRADYLARLAEAEKNNPKRAKEMKDLSRRLGDDF